MTRRWRHRRQGGLAADRRTLGLGLVALGLSGTVIAGEVARVWRHGDAPLPTETEDVLGAAEVAVVQTVEVAREGYRQSTPAQSALLNLLGAYTLTFAIVRASTHRIRSRGTFGPFRDLRVGSSHIHHFVPGIAIAFMAGGAGIVSRDERIDPWLAIPFGAGVAMTLDESALLLRLDDVYWTREGIVSVHVTLSALAMFSAIALTVRLLRRGEREVLDVYAGAGAATDSAPAFVQTT